MKTILLILFSLLFSAYANTLSLKKCFELSEQNYPLIHKRSLIQKTQQFTISNASKGFLPKIFVKGQATYQSDVATVPISIPGMNIPAPEKDQYKVYTEIIQPITGIYTTTQQKKMAKAKGEVKKQGLKVALYQLHQRIEQLYFGILLMQSKIDQTNLVQQEINSELLKVQSAVTNGIVSSLNQNRLQAELLKLQQVLIELHTTKNGFSNVLGLFLNQTIDSTTQFSLPESSSLSEENTRPELALFAKQQKQIQIQNKLLTAKNLPQLNGYFQGGYGKPGLNFFNTNFETYYLIGLQLNWNLSSLYTFSKERKTLVNSQKQLEIEKQLFLFNTNLNLQQIKSEINKYKQLLKSDDELIQLLDLITQKSKSQLNNGTLSAIDYLSAVNAENRAKQNKIYHNIQLLKAQSNYQTSVGNP